MEFIDKIKKIFTKETSVVERPTYLSADFSHRTVVDGVTYVYHTPSKELIKYADIWLDIYDEFGEQGFTPKALPIKD